MMTPLEPHVRAFVESVPLGLLGTKRSDGHRRQSALY
jgi:hypothetical protein